MTPGSVDQDTYRKGATTRGVTGLVLLLVWPLTGFLAGLAIVFAGLPPFVATLAALVLPAGMVLVWSLPAPERARRWIGTAALFAIAHAAIGVFLPQPELPAAPQDLVGDPEAVAALGELAVELWPVHALSLLLVGAAWALFAWGMRRWLRPAGESRSATWWTIYAVLAVVTAALAAAQSPMPAADPGALTVLGAILALTSGLATLAELAVHMGACLTGIGAIRRLASEPPGERTPAEG